jgi:hypothetical protein|tara:strand:+ start:124 stop:333 length:210 start_codon:yes stop_codon:yes gene_type:complete
MAKRLQEVDAQALLNIRKELITAYNRIIDADHSTRQVAQCKQSDVDQIIVRTVKSLEQVLSAAADVRFK